MPTKDEKIMPEGISKPSAEKSVSEVDTYKKHVFSTLETRFNQLRHQFETETNMCSRYELRLKMEEIQGIYSTLNK